MAEWSCYNWVWQTMAHGLDLVHGLGAQQWAPVFGCRHSTHAFMGTDKQWPGPSAYLPLIQDGSFQPTAGKEYLPMLQYLFTMDMIVLLPLGVGLRIFPSLFQGLPLW